MAAIVRQNISHRTLVRIINKSLAGRYEFIAINSPARSGRYNIVAARKMWDRDMEKLYDAGVEHWKQQVQKHEKKH
jgi:hypothetical protein